MFSCIANFQDAKNVATFLCIKEENLVKYKVTKRIPGVYVSETKIFKTKKAAIKQFREWLE